MKILITPKSMIKDIQESFNQFFPFLRLEFYKNYSIADGPVKKEHLQNNILVSTAGLIHATNFELNDLMTVGQLEYNFRMECGLTVQVSRKSGTIWLETTMTYNWTLKQQNDHGKELSDPVLTTILSKDRYLD